MWNLTCRKTIRGLREGIKYPVEYHDEISFKVTGERNHIWIMTRQDIIDIFKIIL